MRLVFCLLVLALAAPVWAFDFPDPAPRAAALFDLDDDFARAQDPAPAPTETPDEERPIYDWYGRGFGISLVATGALVFPAAGIGLEVTMPVHAQLGLNLGGGVIGGIFFEGCYFDFGVRGYLDFSMNFSMYADVGMKLTYGRVLDYFGGNPDDPIESVGIGGYTNLGFEAGSTMLRFFFDITLNGVYTVKTHYQVEFFMGLRFGFRIYVGG
jgi:hypothetical protein